MRKSTEVRKLTKPRKEEAQESGNMPEEIKPYMTVMELEEWFFLWIRQQHPHPAQTPFIYISCS